MVVFTNIFFKKRQHPVLPSVNNTQRQENVSSLNTTKYYEAPPFNNITQYHDISHQFVSFDDSIYDGRRLGNQIFGFAAVLFVAQLTGLRPVLKNSTKRLLLEDVFQLNLERVDNLCPCYTIDEVRHLSYDQNTEKKILKAANKSILMKGFRQSWKYTMMIEHRLRRHLLFKDEIRRFAEDFLQRNIPPRWKKAGFVRVGIHVRRGDNTKESSFKIGYTVANATYFENAMKFFIERYIRVQFIAMSDDPAWIIENIVNPNNTSSTVMVNVTYSLGHSVGHDMAILSLCDHVIMSTGTFGWWGAWLAKGTTIYYKDWPRPGSTLYHHFIKEDFFSPSWIPMTS